MKRFMLLFVACLIGTAGLAIPAASAADAAASYPDRPVKLVLPYRPGGQSDLLARKIADLSVKYKLFSQPMVVVSMPGANTRTALRFVQEADPDGYTLLVHHSTFLAMHSVGQIPMSFRDYDAVAQAVRMPMASFISLPDAPWKNWKEMIEYAKKNNKILNIAISGLGGTTHLMYSYITQATGTADLFRPAFFSGQTESRAALMGKKVDAYGDAPAGGIGYVRAGGGKLLIMSDDIRRPDFPDANNFTDFDIKDLVYMRTGLWAPKGTPPAILEKLQTVVKKATETPEFAEYCETQACDPEFLTGKQYEAQFDEDEKIFQKLAGDLKKSIEEEQARQKAAAKQ